MCATSSRRSGSVSAKIGSTSRSSSAIFQTASKSTALPPGAADRWPGRLRSWPLARPSRPLVRLRPIPKGASSRLAIQEPPTYRDRSSAPAAADHLAGPGDGCARQHALDGVGGLRSMSSGGFDVHPVGVTVVLDDKYPHARSVSPLDVLADAPPSMQVDCAHLALNVWKTAFAL